MAGSTPSGNVENIFEELSYGPAKEGDSLVQVQCFLFLSVSLGHCESECELYMCDLVRLIQDKIVYLHQVDLRFCLFSTIYFIDVESRINITI